MNPLGGAAVRDPARAAFEAAWQLALTDFTSTVRIPCPNVAELLGAPCPQELSPLQRVKGLVVDALVEAGWTPFHAASVRVNGRVVAFLGPSRAGKSTVAALLAKAGLASADDLVLLRSRGRRIDVAVPAVPLALAAEHAVRLGLPEGWPEWPEPGQKSLFLHAPALSGVHELGASCMLDLRPDGAPLRARSARAHEAARALIAGMARFAAAGALRSVDRRHAWALFSRVNELAPAFVLSGDAAGAGGAALAKMLAGLKGDGHVRHDVAD